MKEEYRSRVYTDRPAYADLDAPEKFQAIMGITMTHLAHHPNAICSYSGGSDSDIMIDLIETARKIAPQLPKVKYVFFNTGLEMKATKDHVRATAEKYGVEIEEIRPKIGIVQAARNCGIPFVSKIMSSGLEGWQKKGIPLSIAEEYNNAVDKAQKRKELKERYPKCESLINFLCCCNSAGEPRPNIQLVINSSKYMRDFISEYPPDFKISAKCCEYCKKQAAHMAQKGEKAPQHNYLFLTKNPARYIELAEKGILRRSDNMWYGSTGTAMEEYFSSEKTYNTFLSIEPMFSSISPLTIEGIRWIIIGAITGPGSSEYVRPKREWIERIVSFADSEGIPVFMKDSLIPIIGEEKMHRDFPWKGMHTPKSGI